MPNANRITEARLDLPKMCSYHAAFPVAAPELASASAGVAGHKALTPCRELVFPGLRRTF